MNENLLFDSQALCDALVRQGYFIARKALDPELLLALMLEAQAGDPGFRPAAIGRGEEQVEDLTIRNDEIAWMNGATPAQMHWLQVMRHLQQDINRDLFLGLFSFESHFAHYAPGHFYHTHYDAFRGEANRRLSVVLYLNQRWQSSWGGELVLYDEHERLLQKVSPHLGTFVAFLSEEFPHEVLPATHDRFSIAGWFRVNASHANKVDPPR